jgi:hypothetical protein
MLNKLKSVKVLVLLWIVIVISLIIFLNMIDWLPLVQILAWAPLGYFGANVAQDKIYADKAKGN